MKEVIFNVADYKTPYETYKDFYEDVFIKLDGKGIIDFENMPTLYYSADCLNELDRAVSDDYGYVEFPGHGAGTYYLKEITAPTGYELKDAVYRAEISGGVARIFDDTDTPITSVINEKSSSSGIILPETGRAGTKRVLRSGAMAISIGFLLMWAFLPEQRREKRKLVRLNRFQRTPKK